MFIKYSEGGREDIKGGLPNLYPIPRGGLKGGHRQKSRYERRGSNFILDKCAKYPPPPPSEYLMNIPLYEVLFCIILTNFHSRITTISVLHICMKPLFLLLYIFNFIYLFFVLFLCLFIYLSIFNKLHVKRFCSSQYIHNYLYPQRPGTADSVISEAFYTPRPHTSNTLILPR
jgi:hypothetical protein